MFVRLFVGCWFRYDRENTVQRNADMQERAPQLREKLQGLKGDADTLAEERPDYIDEAHNYDTLVRPAAHLRVVIACPCSCRSHPRVAVACVRACGCGRTAEWQRLVRGLTLIS